MVDFYKEEAKLMGILKGERVRMEANERELRLEEQAKAREEQAEAEAQPKPTTTTKITKKKAIATKPRTNHRHTVELVKK